MSSGPPKLLETLAGLLVPPACREEVLGDLHERYRSPGQYFVDLVTTAPFVILSQVRRTTDIQLLPTEALVVYASFLAMAWFFDRPLLSEQSGLLHLGIPAAITLVFVRLLNAWESPGSKPSLFLIILGAGMVLSDFLEPVLPLGIVRYGFYSGLILALMARWWVQSGAVGPALLVNRGSGQVEMSRTAKLVQDAAVTLLCLVVAATLIVLMPRIVYLVIVLVTWAIGYRFLKHR